MVLMTDPTHASHIPGKGRYYTHPLTGEMWPSVTNVLDTSVVKHALVPWAAKAAAEKALQVLPRLVAASRIPACKVKRGQERCGRCRDCLLREIKAEPKVVRDTAADLGDRIHKWAQAHVLGTPVPHDPEVVPFGKQLLRFFVEFGVDFERDVEATEATIINRTVGYAGTGDLWLWLTIDGRRRLAMVDYKSSSTRPAMSVYPEQGMQLAALANAEKVLLDDGTELDPPGPIEDAYILTLRAADYALIPMPMGGDLDAAFTAFKGALVNAAYLHSQYGLKPTRTVPKSAASKKVA